MIIFSLCTDYSTIVFLFSGVYIILRVSSPSGAYGFDKFGLYVTIEIGLYHQEPLGLPRSLV